MQGINKVKGYRVMVNMTMEDMANAIGITVRSYIQKENGESNRGFTVNELLAIKNVLAEKGLGVTLDDLAA